jgi:hypothetical protein
MKADEAQTLDVLGFPLRIFMCVILRLPLHSYI